MDDFDVPEGMVLVRREDVDHLIEALEAYAAEKGKAACRKCAEIRQRLVDLINTADEQGVADHG